MKSIRRIGIFGGSFNPIHNGHISMARGVMEEFQLDRILFVVAKDPPHKEIEGHVEAHIRYDMVRLALRKEPCMLASDMELRRDGKSYTADTVAQVQSLYPVAAIYLIMGADMLLSLSRWHEPQWLIRNAHIVAVGRPEVAGDLKEEAARLMAQGGDISIASFRGENISSTEVRRRVYDARPIGALVPAEVENYLYRTGLYQPERIREIQDGLRESLTEKRYLHSVMTMRTAIALAARYDEDPGKARLASLLHDCAKFDGEAQRALALQHGMILDPWEELSPGLLHDRLGEILARDTYRVYDGDVLSAIRSHTLCRIGVTKLEKIVYLADKIEPMRTGADVDKIREVAETDLNHAVLLCMDRSIAHVEKAGKRPKPDTERARAHLMQEMNTLESKSAKGEDNLSEAIRNQALKLCETLYNKKAIDILAVNVADRTVVADWFVICSGRTATQVKALCDEAEDRAAEFGLEIRRKEGYQAGRWIVIDLGSILVHIFHPEEREYYNLERLWMDDPSKCVDYSRERE